MIEILINDDKSGGYNNNHNFFSERDSWAKKNCNSYAGMHIQDVGDVSYLWDEIACYRFTDAKDATMFNLKWL
jgi:hypothetical protein